MSLLNYWPTQKRAFWDRLITWPQLLISSWVAAIHPSLCLGRVMADPENAESTALIEHKVQRGTAVNR